MTTTPEAALRVTVIDALAAAAVKQMTRERTEAEPVFKAATSGLRASKGAIQIEIPLPDGTVIGRLSVKAGQTVTTKTVDDVGLHEWVAERNPEALEEYALSTAEYDARVLDLLQRECPEALGVHVKPGMLDDPRVLGLLREHCPALLSSRVREGTRKAYLAEAAKAAEGKPKGWLLDPSSGEQLHLTTETETQEPPTGAFAFIGSETEARRQAVMTALAAGDPAVRAIAFGAVGALSPVLDAIERGPAT